MYLGARGRGLFPLILTLVLALSLAPHATAYISSVIPTNNLLELSHLPAQARASPGHAHPIARIDRPGAMRMSLSGGGAPERGASPLRQRVELLVYIFFWYAASVVCTNTTKQLGLHWSMLTLSQLSISSLCGFLLIRVARFVPYTPIQSRDQLKTTALLAAVFAAGFITLNSALGLMHVSLVMTLRATEPLFTLIIASVLLKTEQLSLPMMLALLPVVFGAALSSVESSDFNLPGLAIVVVCNIMFALRGVVTKRLKASHEVDNFNLFFQVSYLGAMMQAGLLLLAAPLGSLSTALPLARRVLEPGYGLMLLVNGITFWMYLQLSWIVLGRVTTVTHSVCNSLRRPVMCVAGWLQFGNEISPLSAAGIALASAGSLLYSQVRVAAGKSGD